MPTDLQLSADAVKNVGLPVAYLLFNVSFCVWVVGFSMWLVRQANARADKAEQRNEALQAQMLRLATAQTEATLKAASALNSVAQPVVKP